MSESLPAPLVPAEVDLRDFPFIPLHIERLRRSRSWLVAKKRPELGFYMLNLWAASWHEVPAASLDDDDEVLADRAMCDGTKWTEVRAQVLRGWVKCADGRLYHPVVAEVALEAWEARVTARTRARAGAAKRWAGNAQAMPKHKKRNAQAMLKHSPSNAQALPEDSRGIGEAMPGQCPSNAEAMLERSKGSEAKRSDILNRGVELTGRSLPSGAVESLKTAIRKKSNGENHDPSAQADGAGQQWENPQWWQATAVTLQCPRRQGESDTDWRDRVYAAKDQRMQAAP